MALSGFEMGVRPPKSTWESVDMVEPVLGDAFGELLRRCWAGGGVPGLATEVIERDDGFVGVGDVARYFAGTDSWSVHEVSAARVARGRVLDVGCGAGRHMVALRDRGLDVVGVDPSPGAVAVCQERGLPAQLGSIDQLPSGPYDTILLFGSNLGLLGSPSAAVARLRGLAGVAAPDARIIGSNADPYGAGDPVHTGYHRRNREHGRPGGQLRLRVRHAAMATEWFEYWLMSVAELEEVVAGSPWRIEEVHHDSTTGATYGVVLALR